MERDVPIVIRNAFVTTLAMTIGCTSAAIAQNSCANVVTLGTYDQSGLTETPDYGLINAVGTFRIEGEKDESKQPMFNLAILSCEKGTDYAGKERLVCKVTQAAVIASSEKPNTNVPNCDLDLVVYTYVMKEMQGNVLTGMEQSSSGGCYDSMLTINRDTKRVYRSFTRAKHADEYDKIMPKGCGSGSAPLQVLMNCTNWAKFRHALGDAQKQTETPSRYCDFSSASDKLK
jgi:hypothetical protein